MTHVAARFSRFLLVLALLVSIGGHWALLQSVAWTQMLIERSQQGSLVEAVKTTFDGAHPCSLCKRISDDQEEKTPPAHSLVKLKLDLLLTPQVALLFNAAAPHDWPHLEASFQILAGQPLLPPPRSA